MAGHESCKRVAGLPCKLRRTMTKFHWHRHQVCMQKLYTWPATSHVREVAGLPCKLRRTMTKFHWHRHQVCMQKLYTWPATSHVREVAGFENQQKLPGLLPAAVQIKILIPLDVPNILLCGPHPDQASRL